MNMLKFTLILNQNLILKIKYSDQTWMNITIIAIKIRLCHLLSGTTLTTNFGGKSIQVKRSVVHEACKKNVWLNRPMFCWERMSKCHPVVGVLSVLKNVKMAELMKNRIMMNDQEAQLSDESLVFLIHRALVFTRVKKKGIDILWYVSK